MRDWIIKILSEITKRNAVNPLNGGPGELERGNYIEELLKEMGLKVQRFDVEDDKGFTRPNLITEIGSGETIWIISHIDTVSPGEGWESDPFKLRIQGDKVYGLGVHDNGIGIMSSLILLKKILDEDIEINYRLKVGFVSDEEAGSKYGLKFLVSKGIFKEGDRAIVPDAGSEDGSIIEIAEKGILWLKFETKGKQSHGSAPDKGDNAFLKSMRFALELYDELHKKFGEKNDMFNPPVSTFEPTKKERNVDSINIIPGRDIHYWDCRILPRYRIDDVLSVISKVASKYDTVYEVIVREEASETKRDDWIVKKMVEAVKNVLNIEAKLIGIGGGTFAGILRKIGVPSVVWHIGSESEHRPNEWESIENYFKTADVILNVLTSN